MEMMLKMGQLGLKCVVKDPKQRPTMTLVWQELESALSLIDNVIHKQPSNHLWRSASSRSSQLTEIWNQDSTTLVSSQNSISIDAIQLQKFYIAMDNLSFPSENLRWLDNNSADVDGYDSQNLKAAIKETIIAVEDYNMSR